LSGPPPKITTSEWADRFRYIPKGSAAEYGKWETSRAPYQREMMDAASDANVEEIVYMTASQIGKTEILNNAIGYYIDQDPCPILAVAPTVELAESWSKDRIALSIEATPRLKDRVKEAKSRDSGNTISHKQFPGGHLTLVGANAPAGLAQRPIRIVIADDVDRFPGSAGSEGDPISLAKRRTATFWNRKIILASTPTTKGMSRIEEGWEESDQRRFHVPCPRCGAEQVLKWSPTTASLGYEGRGGIVYEKDARDDPVKESAAYQCGECLGRIDESEKWEMMRRGRWIARYPEREMRGYHVSALYSPWGRWSEIVAEWAAAHRRPERLKTFINTILGESWEEEGDSLEVEALKDRQEEFAAPVPNGVGVVVAAVDVQSDRLEMVVKGFGADEESWTIEHLVFSGDPGHESVWNDLDRALAGKWRHQSGRMISIECVVVDSGGQHTDQVYRFCAVRARRRIYAIKGATGAREVVGKPSKTERYRNKLFIVGVDTAKDRVWSRLKTHRPEEGKAGPGFIHLSMTLSDEYLEQLVSERPVKKWQRGKGWRREWVKTRERNEAWDLEVYSLAALYILGSGMVRVLGERAKKWSEPFAEVATSKGVAASTVPGRFRRRPGWMSGLKK